MIAVATVFVASLLISLPAPARASATPATTAKDMSFFLHFVNATETARPIPGASTSTYFDSTTDWNDTNETFAASGSPQSFSWYLSPALAAPVNVSGYSLLIWAQFLSGTPNAQTAVDLVERRATGAESLVESASFGSAAYSSSPALKHLNRTLGSLHTFAAGSSIKVSLTVDPGAGSMILLFDTESADSRIAFRTKEAIGLASVDVLDYRLSPTTSLDSRSANTTAHFRATVSDPYGGYDIKFAYVTILSPAGAVLWTAPMARISGDTTSYLSVYDFVWNYSGQPAGEYIARVIVMDRNGDNWFDHFAQGTYGPYGAELDRAFFVSGLPLYVWVMVSDNGAVALPSAAVAIQVAGVNVTTALTNASGLANLTVLAGNYTLATWWQGVLVGAQPVNLSDNVSAATPILVRASVFDPALVVLDSRSRPVADAFLYLGYPNGTASIVPFRSDAAGRVQLSRIPAGELKVRALWRGAEVASLALAVASSGNHTVAAAVYTLTVTVTGNSGNPLPGAGVLISVAGTGFTAGFNSTDATGSFEERLPTGVYDLAATWSGSLVANLSAIPLTADRIVTLTARVFALSVTVLRGASITLPDAVVVLETTGGEFSKTAVTAANGTVFYLVPGGPYDLVAAWRGVEVASAPVTVASDSNVTLQARVYTLTLEVDDAQDAPIAGAAVALRFNTSGDIYGVAVTGGDGRASFLVPSESFDAFVGWHSVPVGEAYGTVVAAETSLTVSARVYALTIQLKDATGSPVADAGVTLRASPSGEVFDVAVADADGAATFRVPAQAYTANATWMGLEVAAAPQFEVASSQSMILQARVYRLTVSVSDADGAALADAVVTLRASSGPVFAVEVTGADGTASFRAPGQSYDLGVTWRGAGVASVLTYSLRASGQLNINATVYTLKVKALKSDGSALPGAAVTLKTEAGAIFGVGVTGSDGTVSFRVPGATYRLEAHYVGSEFWTLIDERQPATNVALGQSRTVDLNFQSVPGSFVGSNMFFATLSAVLPAGLLVLSFRRRKGRGGEVQVETSRVDAEVEGKPAVPPAAPAGPEPAAVGERLRQLEYRQEYEKLYGPQAHEGEEPRPPAEPVPEAAAPAAAPACPNCGSPPEVGWKVCPQCGLSLEWGQS